MGLVVRTLVAVTVLVVPGAFLLLIAYAVFRAVRHSWRLAAGQSEDGRVAVRDVLAQVSFRDVVREARGAAF